MPDLPLGRLGRWRLERLLGVGAASQVFLGVDPQGRRAAVKRLRSRAALERERFAREAEALARLDHPGIARLLDADLTAATPWLAMTVVDGPTLETYADTLRRRPPRERVERARAIAAALAGALAAVHAAGLVHRDVKPQNVLVDAAGLPMLLDLGLVAGTPPGFPPAEIGDPPGKLVGTPATAAPEQHRGEATPAADQYGLGCTLHLLLTGRRVFDDREGDALLRAHREEDPPPPSRWDPTVPADLDAVVLRLLAKAPRARFATMEEAGAALLADGAVAAPLGLPLAGRQDALDEIAEVVRQALAGEGTILHFAGGPGSGRRRLASLARDAADRAGVTWVDAPDAARLAAARARLHAGEPLLVLSSQPSPDARVIPLPPLSLADVRRSLHGRIDDRTDLARAAEVLHRRSGGNPGLLLRLLAPGPPDLSPWLAGLSLPAAALARALAAAPLGLPPSPADGPARAELVSRGVAVVEPGVVRLAAEELRAALLPGAPPPPPPGELRALVDALLDAPPGDPVPLARSLVHRADALDDAPLRAASRVALAWLLWEAGDLASVATVAADASAAARAAGDTDARVLAHALRAATTLAPPAGSPWPGAGDRVRATIALDRLVSAAPDGASPTVLALWHLVRATALDASGDPRSALRARAEAAALVQAPGSTPLQRHVRAWVMAQLPPD